MEIMKLTALELGRKIRAGEIAVAEAVAAALSAIEKKDAEINGFVTVDRNMAANLPGVFAAGDCTGSPLQVSKAVGEGLVAGQKAAAFASSLLTKKEANES